MPKAPWSEIADLIESVAGSGTLVAEAVEEVRATQPQMATLDAGDVARHTRALLAAATRAIAARRGPTDAELSFVEDLAVTRARQGIPIEAVLAAIHVAERRIWAAARERARADGVPQGQVLDARELYDDWAESVRTRLIVAHRRAEASARTTGHDRPGRLLRRLLDGGAAAALAAAEAGLRAAEVRVVVVPDAPREAVRPLVAALRARGAGGTEEGVVVGVVGSLTEGLRSALSGVPCGVAGPGAAEEVPSLRRLAGAAAEVAADEGRRGPTDVADVAVRVALDARPDLAAALLERHRPALGALGRRAADTADTVRAWVECGQDADVAASRLFVHPNTVRNRVGAMAAASGLDPRDPFDAVTLWWLAREVGEPAASTSSGAGREVV
jgi:hypothetical protein